MGALGVEEEGVEEMGGRRGHAGYVGGGGNEEGMGEMGDGGKEEGMGEMGGTQYLLHMPEISHTVPPMQIPVGVPVQLSFSSMPENTRRSVQLRIQCTVLKQCGCGPLC